VTLIIVAIVAPVGDRSMETRRSCLDSDRAFFAEVISVTFGRAVAFSATSAFCDFGAFRWSFGFGMEILRSVDSGVAPHHRSPTSANKPAGRDLGGLYKALNSRSTAPIAAEGQSFLDNLIAQKRG
jgi:hypothetical protein